MSRSALAYCLLGLLPAVAQSGSPSQTSAETIAEIRCDPPAPGERFLDRLPVHAGVRYDPAAIRESIAILYATGRFTDIEVDATPAAGGLRLTFRTQLNFFVGQVSVTGIKDHPTPIQAINVTKLQLGEEYTDTKRDRAIEGIGRLLENNGYHEAHVSPRIDAHPETQQIDVAFDIAPGHRARVGDVQWQGDPGFPPERLMAASHLKAGQAVTAQRLQNALQSARRFYAHQQLLSATVTLIERRYNAKDGRETLVFRAIQGPKIYVTAEQSGLSASKLRSILPIYDEGDADLDLVRAGARDLRDYLQSRGYFEAKVEGEPVDDLRRGIIRVDYQVERGPKHRLDRIEVEGNHFFNTPTLLERMSISPHSLTNTGEFSRSLLDQDIVTIKQLYQANGFRAVAIEAVVDDDYQHHIGLVHVRLKVVEGPQTLVGKLRLEGAEQIPAAQLLKVISQREGQAFSEENASADRDSVLAYYYDRGFPSAQFSWTASPMEDESGQSRVRVVYAVQEGQHETVDRVLIAGEERTRLPLIERQIEMQPGRPLSQTERLDTQRNLYDLGVFSRVDLAVQNPDGDETNRTMLLQLEEGSRWTIAYGVGAEIARIGGGAYSLDSPEGTETISPRVSLDVTRSDLFGRGQTLAFKSLVGTVEQRGSLIYTAPRVFEHPKLTFYVSGLADRTSDIRTFTSEKYEASVALAWKRSRSDTLIYRVAYRRVSIDANTLKIAPSLIPIESKPVRVGIPSVTYIRDRRDNPADSHHGYYLTVDAGVSTGLLGSQADFTHLYTQYTNYFPLGKDLVLARNTLFGMQQSYGGLRTETVTNPDGTTSVEYTNAVPLAENFFSGGSNSDRAFSINQAGPRDLTTGFPIGGNGLLMNSLELRFPVSRPNIGGVVFWDGGNVYDTVGDINFHLHQHGVTDFDYMVHAAGLGVRFKTPIGPVRVDLAWAFNPPVFYGLQGTETQLLNGTAPRVLRDLSHLQFFFSIGQTY